MRLPIAFVVPIWVVAEPNLTVPVPDEIVSALAVSLALLSIVDSKLSPILWTKNKVQY